MGRPFWEYIYEKQTAREGQPPPIQNNYGRRLSPIQKSKNPKQVLQALSLDLKRALKKHLIMYETITQQQKTKQ